MLVAPDVIPALTIPGSRIDVADERNEPLRLGSRRRATRSIREVFKLSRTLAHASVILHGDGFRCYDKPGEVSAVSPSGPRAYRAA